MTRVLVVEDDHHLVRALTLNLTARHYVVDTAHDGSGALRLAAAHPPDALLVDLGLPDMDGVDVIRGVRGWTAVPILVLSGRRSSSAKIEAFDAGADDYLTKPFDMAELLARLRAAVRRSATTAASRCTPPVITTDTFRIDLAAKKALRGDRTVRLTPTEWRLLEILVRHPGCLVSQRHLLHKVWGPTHGSRTHYLRVYMAQLRRKLEADPAHPRHLITEPGMGYRFEP